MARTQTLATTATTMMMIVCMLMAVRMLPRSERKSSRAEPDGGGAIGDGGGAIGEGGGGATTIATATLSTTVMAGACVTVTARAAESAVRGSDVRALAAASTVRCSALKALGAVPAGGLGTVICACTFTDADEIRSRSWHGSSHARDERKLASRLARALEPRAKSLTSPAICKLSVITVACTWTTAWPAETGAKGGTAGEGGSSGGGGEGGFFGDGLGLGGGNAPLGSVAFPLEGGGEGSGGDGDGGGGGGGAGSREGGGDAVGGGGGESADIEG